MIKGRNLCRNSARWVIGSGNQVNISNDNWLASGEKAVLKEGATASLVGDLLDSSKNWDTNLLRQNLSPKSAIDALKTPISWSSSSDQLFWPHDKDGIYTVKSGYRAIVDSQTAADVFSGPSTSFSNPQPLWDIIWKAAAPDKIKIFV